MVSTQYFYPIYLTQSNPREVTTRMTVVACGTDPAVSTEYFFAHISPNQIQKTSRPREVFRRRGLSARFRVEICCRFGATDSGGDRRCLRNRRCGQYSGSVPAGATVSLPCADTTTQFLFVQFPTTDHMNFCELDVCALGEFRDTCVCHGPHLPVISREFLVLQSGWF